MTTCQEWAVIGRSATDSIRGSGRAPGRARPRRPSLTSPKAHFVYGLLHESVRPTHPPQSARSAASTAPASSSRSASHPPQKKRSVTSFVAGKPSSARSCAHATTSPSSSPAAGSYSARARTGPKSTASGSAHCSGTIDSGPRTVACSVSISRYSTTKSADVRISTTRSRSSPSVTPPNRSSIDFAASVASTHSLP